MDFFAKTAMLSPQKLIHLRKGIRCGDDRNPEETLRDSCPFRNLIQKSLPTALSVSCNKIRNLLIG